MSKNLFLAILLGVITIFGAYFILSDFYPVALVDFKIINARDFNKDYSGALIYYKNALDVYVRDSALINADEVKNELKRAVLDNLIENILIDKELKSELSFSDIDELADKKIEEATRGKSVKEEAKTLYGFYYEEFKDRVLIPQAKKEILEERLFSKRENFEEKIIEAKSKAKVMIFLSGFEWNGKEVIIRP
ncbi:MAG: hypothetical protein AAB496_01400 [Patescibacteria group bacterium]